MKKITFAFLILVLLFIIPSCTENKSTENTSEATKNSPQHDTVIESVPKENNASSIYKSCSKAVVLVISYDLNGIPLSQGTGFYIDSNKIVTNFHVIDGSSYLKVKNLGDESFKKAKVISASEANDLAILKTKETSVHLNLDTISDKNIGEKIFTIGNPRGFEGTISEGIISALREETQTYIQITAPISPGNSGGPVINKEGKVIGVSTFTIINSQNLNFAVPTTYLSECKPYTPSPRKKQSSKKKTIKNKTAVTVSKYVKNGSEFTEQIGFKNHTNDFIKSIYGILIYKDLKGNVFNYTVIDRRITIPPHLAKMITIRSFDQEQNFAYYKSDSEFYEKFNIEFRLLTYEKEEF